MSDKQRKTKMMKFLDRPVNVPGYYLDVLGVSLSRRESTGTDHVGVLFGTGLVLDPPLHVFLSLPDALLLRDMLEDILKVYRAEQSGSN